MWDEFRGIVPADIILAVAHSTNRMRTKCCEFHNSVLTAEANRFLLTSPSCRLASRTSAGPRTNILPSRTSNLARGSDVDCLIRPCLKFCQLTAGFSGSLPEKQTNAQYTLCADRHRHGTRKGGTKDTIGEHYSLSVHYHSKELIDSK